MKILYLTHTFPYPPNDGMRSTCFQLIKHMSKNNSVSLLSLMESEEDKKFIPEMMKWCPDVEVVAHAVPRSALLRIKNVLFESTPFCVTQFFNQEFAEKLKSKLASGQFDVVHFLSVNVAGYREWIGRTPGLFFPHDSVSMQFERNAEREPALLRKLYLYSQARKMKGFEKREIPKFDRTVIVSEVDRKWIHAFCPDVKIPVIPGGVDPEQFKKLDEKEDFPSVIFRGVMDFIPNSDAVSYFHSEIMPLVQKEFPDLKFYAVGKNPPPAIRNLHDGKTTFVTGLVEDIRPPMARATVNICPMRSGSGMKNKILEAWAMEKCVVATTLACDGIDVEPGKNILIADTPETFAQSVIRLLKDPELRAELGRNGRRKAIQKYTWSYVAALFEEVYRDMISNKGLPVQRGAAMGQAMHLEAVRP